MRITRGRRGSALLAVLWLAAALAAIAFTLANTVRGEMDRASTSVDGLRSYYLAEGGIQRAVLEMLWQTQKTGMRVRPGVTVLPFSFPSGEVRVEVIPETAKLDLNTALPGQLYRLMTALGVEPDERVREIVAAIVDWRTPSPVPTRFDQYYLNVSPTFRARHASFEETEELLLVRGMTPDIYYGTWLAAADSNGGGPRLTPRLGLADCVSVYGSPYSFDVNTVPGPVLAAVGFTPDVINAILVRRRVAPIAKQEEMAQLAAAVPQAASRLRLGGNTIYTLRATARLRLPDGRFSDLRRSVAAQVKFLPPGYPMPFHYLRWYDSVWTN